MEGQPEHAIGEIKRLQGCISDLVSLLALPAIWSGGDPSQVLHILLDALLRMLELDLACVRLKDPVGEAGAIVRGARLRGPMPAEHEICEALSHCLEEGSRKWPPLLRNLLGEGDVSIVPLPLGLQGELGVIVVAAEREDFPRQTETLLLNVAANQAVIGLQEARLRSQQKRVASELDRQVAQRTAELDAANQELRRELAERSLVEEKLRQEERELKRSEVRKAAILDSALDCIVTIDHEGRITEFNPAAEHTFGYRRDEVLRKHLADVIIPPSLREKHRQGFARYLATGEARVLGRRLEMTAVRADGSEILVEIAITRIPLDGPPSFTGYLRDITEHKRNESALRGAHAQVARSEERWRSVFENSAIGVALTDPNGRFLATNPVYQKMLGYTEAELRKLTFLDITHEEDFEPNRTLIAELLAGKRQQFQIEKQYRRKDGSLVWVRNNVSVVPGSERMQRFLMALSEDITERKLAEEALSKARSELAHVARITSLGVLTASIAHEVNQPLSGIVTNAGTCLRMLAADPPNVVGARETARRTIRDGNRASEVVTRLRALYGKKAPTSESVDLNEAAREVLALSLTELQRNRVILRAELADDLPLVTGDRVQLQQVILNLIRNASDAMRAVDERPRQLLVKTERDEDDRVRLTVQDAGVGFDPQAADKLFESFYTTKNDGMGIGLSVSRSIIESHHGRLWATLNKGPGATFSFSIPRASEGASSADSNRDIDIPDVTDAA
ncbi:MAG: PAS domain S-box protein [Terriglobales bacterium]|jgi:PAS domain S-box-containing protein